MTVFLVVATSIISVMAFYNQQLFELFEFNPYKVVHRKQYWRLITHAFIHADWMHLIFNMIVLFSFGKGLEYYLSILKGMINLQFPVVAYYMAMYFSAIVVASLTTLKKYKDAIFYNSVGASGAVSTIVFACIFFNPWQKLLFLGILPIPGIIFGVLYLIYTQYMSKRNHDNINHDAHLLGALYGFTFPILLEPKLLYGFIEQVFNFSF